MKCTRVAGRVYVRPGRRVRATEESEGKVKLERGFRWDPSLQRWIEDKRNIGKEFSQSDMVIKTKTGDEYVVWPMVHSYLVEKDIKSITASEVEDRVKKGYTLVDVRMEKDFKKGHAKGAINVQLFRQVTRDDAWNQAKKVVSFFMAMTPTERNPDFAKQVAEAVPRKSKVIVMCNRGGTLDTVIVGPGENPKVFDSDPDRAFGRESRSLKAIYELLQDGFTDLVYVEGGMSQWSYDKMEVETS